MVRTQKRRSFVVRAAMMVALYCGISALIGCERKERVLDVETPGGEIEVDRDIDTGKVEVNVTDKD